MRTPKAKAPARKSSANTKTSVKSDQKSDQVPSSPLTRKSARVASKRAAAEATGPPEDEQNQPAKKRMKMSPDEKAAPISKGKKATRATKTTDSPTKLPKAAGRKRDASESNVSNEGEQQPSASRPIIARRTRDISNRLLSCPLSRTNQACR